MEQEALARIEREAGVPGLVEILSERIPGADLTTLLLEVFRVRAAGLDPAAVLRRYESDAFVAPAPPDPVRLLELDRRAFALLPEDWERLELSPVAPLGTCAVLGGMSQNRIVSAVRGQEVVADSTAVLALEAARRRRDGDRPVRLCASHRLLRGQRFEPPFRQHFRLFALVSADRAGSEDELLAEQLAFYERLLEGVDGVEVSVGAADGAYYERQRFRIDVASSDGDRVNVVDGGFTDWTQRLLSDRKERLLTSGVGTELLAGILGVGGV